MSYHGMVTIPCRPHSTRSPDDKSCLLVASAGAAALAQVMLIAGAKSIRDVIAFPKTANGGCLLTRAPGGVSANQLAEVHMQLGPGVKPLP